MDDDVNEPKGQSLVLKPKDGLAIRLNTLVGRGLDLIRQLSPNVVAGLQKATQEGDAEAQFKLGNAYLLGEGVPQDHHEAARWYRKAAEQGHAEAQYNLGIMYDDGKGVPQDYNEAIVWFRKSAEQGHAEAQYNLGIMYDDGKGVPQDYNEAIVWYRKAAEQGDAEAREALRSITTQNIPSERA